MDKIDVISIIYFGFYSIYCIFVVFLQIYFLFKYLFIFYTWTVMMLNTIKEIIVGVCCV